MSEVEKINYIIDKLIGWKSMIKKMLCSPTNDGSDLFSIIIFSLEQYRERLNDEYHEYINETGL